MTNDADRELSEVDAALEATPDDTRLRARQGALLERLGRHEEAIAAYGTALERRPDYPWALAHRGDLYARMGVREYGVLALADLCAALELDRDYVWALAHRGALYKHLRRPRSALPDLDRALELRPDYPWALVYRTEVLVILHRYEDALADARRAVQLEPNIFVGWQAEMALLLNYMSRWDDALAYCEQAWAIDPHDAFAWYSASVAVARSRGLSHAQSHVEEAHARLEQALDGPHRAGALYRLGGLAALRGQTELALGYLQQAGALDNEPLDVAPHDPAWRDLWEHSRFGELVATEDEAT